MCDIGGVNRCIRQKGVRPKCDDAQREMYRCAACVGSTMILVLPDARSLLVPDDSLNVEQSVDNT